MTEKKKGMTIEEMADLGEEKKTPETKEKTTKKEPKVLSGVEKFLNDLGIKDGMIKFQGAENPVEFNSLGADKQYTILNSLFNRGKQESNELSEEETKTIALLREKESTIDDLISIEVKKALKEKDNFNERQQVNFDEMSEQAIYTKFLKDKDPEKTEEDIIAEYEIAKETEGFERSIKATRNVFKNKQALEKEEEISKLNKEIELTREEKRTEIVDDIIPIDNIDGWNITDEIKNEILEDILEVNEDGLSPFADKILNDNKELFKAAYRYNTGEDNFKNIENYYLQKSVSEYERGLREGKEGVVLEDKPTSFAKENAENKTVTNNNDTPGEKTIEELADE